MMPLVEDGKQRLLRRRHLGRPRSALHVGGANGPLWVAAAWRCSEGRIRWTTAHGTRRTVGSSSSVSQSLTEKAVGCYGSLASSWHRMLDAVRPRTRRGCRWHAGMAAVPNL